MLGVCVTFRESGEVEKAYLGFLTKQNSSTLAMASLSVSHQAVYHHDSKTVQIFLMTYVCARYNQSNLGNCWYKI